MGLIAGAPAPFFEAPSPVNPNFAFESLGGLYILLAFLPGPGPERDAALRLIRDSAALFADDRVLFFGVLPDAESFASARNVAPMRWFLDETGELRHKFKATGPDGELAPQWVLIDPGMRIMGWAPLDRGPNVIANIARLEKPELHAGVPPHAPVLIVPRIFEPELCRELIAYYQKDGGSPSGVMQVKDGRTIGVLNDLKRRRDVLVEDATLVGEIRWRLAARLNPQVQKVFQFEVTHLERYLVACYEAEGGGYFRAHRDNTTPGTAHRRFAVTINLNAEDYEGGDLRFPEFGLAAHRPPTGGAVVFSCSLLHEATPVTRGVRYAFLPFLYDLAGERIRQKNLHTLAPSPQAASANVPGR